MTVSLGLDCLAAILLINSTGIFQCKGSAPRPVLTPAALWLDRMQPAVQDWLCLSLPSIEACVALEVFDARADFLHICYDAELRAV